MTARPSLQSDHLARLEAESIEIFREVVAEFPNPVLLYSIGKDSSVLLHLAVKAFYPAPIPFPVLHIDTGWKFKEMIAFRDRRLQELGVKLIAHTNPEGKAEGINPITHGASVHTDIMKTQALRQALRQHGFDAAIGGARRDEEKSRAKERVFSLRNDKMHWDPRQQRPEVWSLYNCKLAAGDSMRVFPLSNWTELDVWRYIHREQIEIVPLYFAKPRPIVWRNGAMLMVDDDRFPLEEGESPELRMVRFRTLGCYPLTAAVDSQAETLDAVLEEMASTRLSERHGRLIDHDQAGAMEQKKRNGYF